MKLKSSLPYVYFKFLEVKFPGLGSTTVGIAPSLVGDTLSGHNVVQIACGSHHSVAVTDRGEIFAWGRNSCGQVG